jgi:hypothetical protein
MGSCSPILYLLYLLGEDLGMWKFTHLGYLGGHIVILRVLHFDRLLWFTIRYGDRLRAVVDVGFSTADNN